jgi:hypothetical protein
VLSGIRDIVVSSLSFSDLVLKFPIFLNTLGSLYYKETQKMEKLWSIVVELLLNSFTLFLFFGITDVH